LVLTALSVSSAATTTSAAITDSADENPIILVMGDSISAGYGIQREQGWVHLLQARLNAHGSNWRVVNASISGETSGGGLARLPQALTVHSPTLMILELGGNDGLRGYPLARIRENLQAIAELALTAGVEVLVVGMQIPPNYGPRYTRGFQSMFTEVAQATGATMVPFLLEDVALEPGFMQSDGIHPTAEAQPLLLDTLWPYLEPLLASGSSPAARVADD